MINLIKNSFDHVPMCHQFHVWEYLHTTRLISPPLWLNSNRIFARSSIKFPLHCKFHWTSYLFLRFYCLRIWTISFVQSLQLLLCRCRSILYISKGGMSIFVYMFFILFYFFIYSSLFLLTSHIIPTRHLSADVTPSYVTFFCVLLRLYRSDKFQNGLFFEQKSGVMVCGSGIHITLCCVI